MVARLSGGLAAPRCFAIVEYPDEETWVWMEYIVETAKSWPLQRYGLAARHLGQFNGAYLVGRPLPEYPWLNRRHSRQWLEMGISGFSELPRLSQSQWSWLTPESATRTLRLYAERERLLDGLEKLPICLCHHDSFRRNVLARHTLQGEEQTGIIDWSAVGPGAPGEDLAKLVVGSVLFRDVPAQDLAQLDSLAFVGYLEGLYDAGWQGDKALVRLGYAASACLCIALGLTGLLLAHVEDEEARATWVEVSGQPIEVLLNDWHDTHNFLLSLGDESLILLEQISVP
jgi:hypothetical protein